MYVYVSMHSLQKGGESPSFHQELVASMHSLQKGGEYANRDDHVYCTGVSPNSPWMPRAMRRCGTPVYVFMVRDTTRRRRRARVARIGMEQRPTMLGAEGLAATR